MEKLKRVKKKKKYVKRATVTVERAGVCVPLYTSTAFGGGQCFG